MKRSSKVALTLLVPSMAAFGCSQTEPPKPTPTSIAAPRKVNPAAHNGKEDEEFVVSQNEDDSEKQNPQSSNLNPTSSSTGQHYHHRSTYFPNVFGGSSNRYQNSPSAPPGRSVAGPVNNGISAPHSTGTGITRGGFGGTGSHLSGGS